MNMPPEKVAVLVITGVIAVLVSVTLLNSSPEGDSRDRDADWAETQGDTSWEEQGGREYDREDVIGGGTGTVLKERPAPGGTGGTTSGSGGTTAHGAGLGRPSGRPAATRLRTWTIKPRDTFESIAIAVFGSSKHTRAVQDANPGVKPRRLRLGMTIKLPDLAAERPVRGGRNLRNPPAQPSAARWYTVRPNDSLQKIARIRYGDYREWKRIWRANRSRMKKPGMIREGQKLLLPAG
ncbi:MAG: hypothetical protein CMJ83_14690 [Planctomycetes bacterium]|nr:hypothetical protein [Planctomycetota bacterium]